MHGWLVYKALRATNDLIRSESHSASRHGDDYILPDERARQTAKARLEAEPDVDTRSIELGVHSGVLSLTGSVSSHAMKLRAGQICRAVVGVTSVRNALIVK